MSERWGALPLGELHPTSICALCGSKEPALKLTVLAMTRARALVCVDVSACERRRYNQLRKIV